MSIYYKDNQSHPYKKETHQNANKPKTYDPLYPPDPFDSPSAQRSKSPERQSASYQKQKNHASQHQVQPHHQFQNLDCVSPKNGKSKSISKTLQPIKDNIETKKSPDKVKQKLSFIVKLFQEEESVAEVSSYHHMSDNDQLDHSVSTIQSNQRHKGKQKQKKAMDRAKAVKQSKQFNKMQRNSKQQEADRERDELVFMEKKKVEEKSRSKFLFYNLIKQQSNIRLQQGHEPANNERPVKKERKTMPIRIGSKPPEYKYEKGVHQKDQDKKDRLKNKLGFIFDIFNKNEEIASVSYYSEKSSQKQSVEALPVQKDQPPAAAENVFNYTENLLPQTLSREQMKVEKMQKEGKSPSKSQAKSNEFQDINIPIKSIEKTKKIDLDTSFANPREPLKNPSSNSRHSPNPNKSLEKIQLQMSLKRRAKEREKLSITKSVDNKPKKTRYEETEELQHLQMVQRQKKSQELSRYIKNSSMIDSSKKPSQNGQHSSKDKLSKSRSEDSKFSIKMLEVSVKKSIEKQAEVPQRPQTLQSPSFMRIQSKQQQEIVEPTVKKTFPIARNIAQNRNSLFSKYMKVDYKQESHQSNSDVLDQQLPSLIKNTDQLPRQRVTQEKNHQLKTDANTGQETSKISFKPVNKVDFNLEKSKKMRTEFIQPKQDLNEQQRKFLALLRKREQALLKRVKQQALNNNPSSLLRDFQQRTKQISNDTFEKLIAKEDNTISKIPSNYFHAQRRQKMSFNTEQYQPKAHFPTLNLSPQSKQQNFQTFYNNPIKRNSSKNIKYLSSKKKGFSEHLSSDSDKGRAFDDRMEEVKGFKRQPSKISYYNIKKLQKDSSLKDRNNLNSKEKYERLKQLLQQI